MKYKHLTIEEREKIQDMLWQKSSIRNIAKTLNRSPSSVSREINRNIRLKRTYRPRLANNRAFENRKSRGRKLRLKNGFIRRYVVSGLKSGLSPEQIAGRLTLEYSDRSISHEAIYQYIYSCVCRDGYGYMRPYYHDLRQYLKRRHKRRVRKGMRKSQRTPKHKGILIDLRPLYIEHRKELGHWEGDSVVSGKSKVRLNTLVERKTGLVFITKVSDGTANQTTRAVLRRLFVLPKKYRKTLTLDNGSENMGHKMITSILGIICYFAHPYASWERGSNENTNGLIRWYFPKGTDFATVSEKDIQKVETALNNRPRKRLGWKTPLEVFKKSVAVRG